MARLTSSACLGAICRSRSPAPAALTRASDGQALCARTCRTRPAPGARRTRSQANSACGLSAGRGRTPPAAARRRGFRHVGPCAYYTKRVRLRGEINRKVRHLNIAPCDYRTSQGATRQLRTLRLSHVAPCEVTTSHLATSACRTLQFKNPTLDPKISPTFRRENCSALGSQGFRGAPKTLQTIMTRPRLDIQRDRHVRGEIKHAPVGRHLVDTEVLKYDILEWSPHTIG